MSWIERYRNEAVATADPQLVRGWEKRLRALGFDDPKILHPFAFRDLSEDLTKHRLLMAYNMGLGKTALAIAAAATRNTKHTLFVVPNKLIGEWEKELTRLGYGDQYQIITSLSQIDGYECSKCGAPVNQYQKVIDASGALVDVVRRCLACGTKAHPRHLDRLARFNLISMRTLWVIPKDSPHVGREKKAEVRDQNNWVVKKGRNRLKWSFAWSLRRRCESVIVDEAYSLANPSALQTRAVFLLKPRRRMLLTGTPVRGYPDNILSLLNWCLGSGTDLFPEFDATQDASVKRFIDAFGTKIQKRRDDGSIYEKYVPKISNPERFQQMLAPVMRRRVNLEPEVAAAIKMPSFLIVPEQIELDPNLRDQYQQAVENFVKWFEEARREAAQNDTTVPQMTTLSKLTFLSQLAAVPQACVPGYDTISSKQQRIIELVEDGIAKGRKVLLFTEFVASAEWYVAQPRLAKLNPTLITGSVSLQRGKTTGTSARERRLTTFREGDSQLLVATTTCFAEGLNVPQAGTVIFDSFPWVPSVQQQAWSRVLRPAQKTNPVEIYLVGMAGTIDDYLSAINALKRAAIAEGIDYETVEIDLDEVPDPLVYAHSLVEASTAVSKTFGALAWIERLKAQATQAQATYASTRRYP